MISSFDKAIVAVIGAILFFLDRAFGVNLGFIDEGTISAIAAVVTPVLVWLLPNRA